MSLVAIVAIATLALIVLAFAVALVERVAQRRELARLRSKVSVSPVAAPVERGTGAMEPHQAT